MNLKEWRKGKGWTQEDLSEKIQEPRPTFQAWETARTEIPSHAKTKLRKLGYEGPWPHEETKEQNQITASDFLDLKAALKAHVEYWRAGEERVLEKLMELSRRISELEKRLGD